jgi:chromosomal replication initiation ATPase DnaA
MDYRYEFIKLKGIHERLKLNHDIKVGSLVRQIDELIAKINQPLNIPTFDKPMAEMLKLVASVTNVFADDIVSHKRNREMVTARALFSYMCRVHLDQPFKRIGVMLNRDHSTIIHLCNNYEDYLRMNYKQETQFYNECINRINNEEAQRVCPYCSHHREGSNFLCEEIH